MAAIVQKYTQRRDWLDHPSHLVAKKQRRGGEGVCQTQVGDPPRTNTREIKQHTDYSAWTRHGLICSSAKESRVLSHFA